MDIPTIGTNPFSNIEQLVQQYMAVERQPIARLQTQKGQLNAKISLYSELSDQLSSLQSKAEDLLEDDFFLQNSATSSDTSKLTATAGTSASAGTYEITITDLATAHRVASEQKSSDWTYTVAAGETHSFTISYGSTTLTVELSGGDTGQSYTLSDIRDAINAEAEEQGSGVYASVVDNTLIIEGELGASNAMSFEDVTGTVLQSLDVIDATGTIQHELQAASDAHFTVNGLSVTRSQNEGIDDVIEGVTLNLLAPTTEAVTLEVGRDTSAITGGINDFISAFNDLMDYLNEQTQVDPTTYTRGALAGDSLVRFVKRELIDSVLQSVSGVSDGNPSSLSQIGITFDEDMHLTISDSGTLNEYIQDNPQAVADLFQLADGVAQRIYDLLNPLTQSGGTIEEQKEVLQDQVEDIDDRIERLEAMLQRREEQIRDELVSLQQALIAAVQQQYFMQSLLYGMYGSTF